MIVVISDAAEQELENIADYIAQDNPERAETFVAELIEQCMALGKRPLAHPIVARYEGHEIRRFVYGNYLVFYRATADAVGIIHILHSAMDYERILFPDT